MVLPPDFAPKGGYGTITSTWWFYDRFEPNDKRKEMLLAEYTSTESGIVYNRSNPGAVLDWGPLPLKMNQDAARTTGLTTVDIVMYRYADILLSKAEALANLGSPTQEAIDLVNEVRARAGLDDELLSDHSSLSAFNDMILLERSHEFWCENGQYRADLIRHGKFISRCQEVTQSTYTNESKIVYPFSLEAVAEGKGVFIQNPGYN